MNTGNDSECTSIVHVRDQNSREQRPAGVGEPQRKPPVHAGGLRYHGVAPLISQLVRDGLVRAEAYLQSDVFASAVLFAGTEGTLPAPESAHAIHGALRAAQAADEAGVERTILFNLSGHGHFDMAAYDNHFAGKLEDVALDEDEMSRALRAIEGLPTPA